VRRRRTKKKLEDSSEGGFKKLDPDPKFSGKRGDLRLLS
jgi:hypothetical protein